MGLFGFVKKSVSDLYVARPDAAAQLLVWRYPDQSIPNGAKLTVRADETVLFFKEGRVLGELPPGTHQLETKHLPFLGDLLVSPLTGDNHFLTELFFVRRTEHLHQVPHDVQQHGPRPLGKFSDVASRHVVGLYFVARVGLRVTDATRLILALGGVQEGAADQVAAFLDARLSSLAAAEVGKLVASEPIMQVASNQYSEELGQRLVERARPAFAPDGLEITRFLELELHLDRESEEALRDFGRKMAELSVQREGAEVAAQPGFAQYHLVQGQRAAMEGAAAGMAQHGLPLLGLGLGAAPLGGVLPLGGMPAASLAPFGAAPAPARLPAPPRAAAARWYLRSSSGIEGPYGARQLVLRARACKLEAASALVRQQGAEDWIGADEDQDLAAEFRRRAAGETTPTPTPAALAARSERDGFERALGVAAADGVLTADELGLLADMAASIGLAPCAEDAQRYVLSRARALGCRIPAETAPGTLAAGAPTAAAPLAAPGAEPVGPSGTPAPPAGESAADLERQLDQLGERLAEGKIGEETYHKLAARLEARLARARGA
ncbi:MAG: SPFH domain-containing protein [Deltaproteobacteria bacterium]|nr:SPFH domain-containing protein [Deltaproteobacteria bacterium]